MQVIDSFKSFAHTNNTKQIVESYAKSDADGYSNHICFEKNGTTASRHVAAMYGKKRPTNSCHESIPPSGVPRGANLILDMTQNWIPANYVLIGFC